MNRLEDITVGSTVKGIVGTEPVSIVAVQWYGSNVLADDPGAGKTIMTGLYIKELMARGDLKRCLIVSPGSLAEQWQDELFSKFHLKFEILTNDRMESAVTGNIFTEVDRCICRLDKLARNDELQEKLKVSEWDLIVCDEAHKMSATVWGGEVKYTRRFQLGGCYRISQEIFCC